MRLLLLGLFACAQEEPVPCAPGYGRLDSGQCVAVEGGSDLSPGTDTASEIETPAAFTAEEAIAAFQGGLDAGLPDSDTLGEAWRTALDAGRGETCPPPGYSLIHGVEGCTSSTGWAYSGPALYLEAEPGVEGFSLEADAYVLRPDGSGLAFGGLMDLSRQERDGVLEWRAELDGFFQDDAAGEPWLKAGVSTTLFIKGKGEGEDLALLLDGGSSSAGAGIVMEELGWTPDCPGQGLLRTVDPIGRGYTLQLDCGGCGPILLGEEPLGEGCVELSAISDLVDRMIGR